MSLTKCTNDLIRINNHLIEPVVGSGPGPGPVLNPYTIRFEFSNPAYDPTTVSGWKDGMSWTRVSGESTNQWDCTYPYSNWSSLFKNKFNSSGELTNEVSVIKGNTTGVINMSSLFNGCNELTYCGTLETSDVTYMNNMFYGCSNLTKVSMFDTSKVTGMQRMFYGCTKLLAIPQFNTSSLGDALEMFAYCYSLTSIPIIDTSKVTNASMMLYECIALRIVPLLDTSNMTGVGGMFYGCRNVETGALALYQRMAGQSVPPSSHTNTFYRCGINTGTGTAELAQIPDNWKNS